MTFFEHPTASQLGFFACFFGRFFRLASFFKSSAFETLSTERSALLMRSASVFPGTFGAGDGFMVLLLVSSGLAFVRYDWRHVLGLLVALAYFYGVGFLGSGCT